MFFISFFLQTLVFSFNGFLPCYSFLWGFLQDLVLGLPYHSILPYHGLFSSMVNLPTVSKRRNKRSTGLHTHGESTAVQERYYFHTSVKSQKPIEKNTEKF